MQSITQKTLAADLRELQEKVSQDVQWYDVQLALFQAAMGSRLPGIQRGMHMLREQAASHEACLAQSASLLESTSPDALAQAVALLSSEAF